VVRVPGYRSRGFGFDSRRYQIFWVAVGLEQGPLSTRYDMRGDTWKKKLRLRSRKLRLTTVRDPPRWLRDTPLSTKVGTKFRRQVAVVSRYISLADQAQRSFFLYPLRPIYKSEIDGPEEPQRWPRLTSVISAKVGTKFAYLPPLLCRYNSLADQKPRSFSASPVKYYGVPTQMTSSSPWLCETQVEDHCSNAELLCIQYIKCWGPLTGFPSPASYATGGIFSRRMVSSGMLRRVALVRTDVSKEPGPSFIRVTRIGELGTTKAATSNRRTLCRFLQEPHNITS
jgi:hypothetical protein